MDRGGAVKPSETWSLRGTFDSDAWEAGAQIGYAVNERIRASAERWAILHGYESHGSNSICHERRGENFPVNQDWEVDKERSGCR